MERHMFFRKKGFYEKYIKRLLDIICSFFVIVFFFWFYIILAILVKWKLGTPIFFKQLRPGLIDQKTNKERIFGMYKFRTMTDERDEDGNLLPDEMRLTPFGKKLRASSLDELPEVINILKGDMSFIGPRPQLVQDMVFMTDAQRMRHTAMPGLSGLAQIKGRNAITWDDKFRWDLKYIQSISFKEDILILMDTLKQVFLRTSTKEELDLSIDYGDDLLQRGLISQEEYDELQEYAKFIIDQHE